MQLRNYVTDDELQILYAEVYAPVVLPDADGDVMTTEEIRSLSYRFMANGDMGCVDTQHNRERNGSVVVESFIATESNPEFITGAWVVGIYVPDATLWKSIKDKDYQGLSLDFDFYAEDVEYEIEIPESVQGTTSMDDDHEHRFIIHFDANGNFIGGETDIVNGHKHPIRHGTHTLYRSGHRHTFSFIELINNGEVILVSESTEE